MSKKHGAGFVNLVDQAKAHVREVGAAQLPSLLQDDPDAALIDVREDSEFTAGHIRGAAHIGKGVIERDIEAAHPNKQQTLYLYCGGGYRSALAANALRQMGYKNAVSVDGGWRQLQDLMPTE